MVVFASWGHLECVFGCPSDLETLLALVGGARGARHPTSSRTALDKHELSHPNARCVLLEMHRSNKKKKKTKVRILAQKHLRSLHRGHGGEN